MTLDHHTSERVYNALKADIRSGVLQTGPVSVSALARRYEASATPVREALMRLVGERLVRLPVSGGFCLDPFDARTVQDLLEASRVLMRHVVASLPLDQFLNISAASDIRAAQEIETMFTALARATGNEQLADIFGLLQDRLATWRPSGKAPGARKGLDEVQVSAALKTVDRPALARIVARHYRRKLAVFGGSRALERFPITLDRSRRS